MSRPPRIQDQPVHILQRTINQELCFYAEEDYLCYLYWLRKSALDSGCAIHAYALMPNHVHLLLTPLHEDSVPDLMHTVSRRYAQSINHYYKRNGALWEEEYAESIIQAETWLLACMRYIELNPIRAGLVVDPGQYQWSSYRSNALGITDKHLTPHALYLAGDQTPKGRIKYYRQSFRKELDDKTITDIRMAITHSQPLGDNGFMERVCIGERWKRAREGNGGP